MGRLSDVLMTAPSNFNKLVPPFLRYKNGPNLVESLLGTIRSYAENPSIFSKNVDRLVNLNILVISTQSVLP